MIDGKNLFDLFKIDIDLLKINRRTYDKIRKTGQGDGYTTSCLLDYVYFKNYFKTRAIDLSKQQALDADPKEIQQIDFTGNLIEQETQQCLSLLKKQKKPF